MSPEVGRSKVPEPKLTLSPVAMVVSAAVLLALGTGLIYLNRPAVALGTVSGQQASAEAKAYLKYLELSDVSMTATENFMKQRVVEVQGKIANKGARPISSAEVYCLFSGIDGHEVHRERAMLVADGRAALGAGESRPFRLPFDALPDGWNQ